MRSRWYSHKSREKKMFEMYFSSFFTDKRIFFSSPVAIKKSLQKNNNFHYYKSMHYAMRQKIHETRRTIYIRSKSLSKYPEKLYKQTDKIDKILKAYYIL